MEELDGIHVQMESMVSGTNLLRHRLLTAFTLLTSISIQRFKPNCQTLCSCLTCVQALKLSAQLGHLLCLGAAVGAALGGLAGLSLAVL